MPNFKPKSTTLISRYDIHARFGLAIDYDDFTSSTSRTSVYVFASSVILRLSLIYLSRPVLLDHTTFCQPTSTGPMDSGHTHAGLEEVERLPSDDSDLKPHTTDRHSDTGTNRHSSATSRGLEKRQNVEIVDWDGPNDAENPYAS